MSFIFTPSSKWGCDTGGRSWESRVRGELKVQGGVGVGNLEGKSRVGSLEARRQVKVEGPRGESRVGSPWVRQEAEGGNQGSEANRDA